MTKRINNITKVLLIVLMLFMSVSACKKNNGDDGGNSEPIVITKELLEALVFEDLTIPYDGEKHSILIDNIYEEYGVTITYTNNDVSAPGVYSIIAKIEYPGLRKITKKAILTIEKLDCYIEAPLTQTINLSAGTPKLTYTDLSNSKQTLVVLDENKNRVTVSNINTPGVYNFEIYFSGNSYYNESEHLNIEVTVVESLFDVVFESKKVIADGNTHSIELTGNISAGYTVEYENNSGSEDGKYYAVANIKDSSGNIVETHRAVLEIENPENEEFAEYLDEFFVWYLEGDQLAVNIFCENPYNFGLEHYEAKWYTYKTITEEDIKHDLELFKEVLVDFEQFKEAPLNNSQEKVYETIRKFLEYNIEYYTIEDSFFMELKYVDQFGGYVADFGTYMESYALRGVAEVEDIVDYIESTLTAFPSYLQYIDEKTEQGYPLSNFTINEMRSYLLEIIEQGNNYYLKDILFEKIDKLDFLSASQKTSYKNDIAYAIEHNFIVGVQALYDGLESYLDILPADQEGYYQIYENGKDLYLLDLEHLLGYENMDTDAYIKEIESQLTAAVRDVISSQQALAREFNFSTYAELEALVNTVAVTSLDNDEMLAYLKNFALTIVPELKSNPEIVVKHMDVASAKKSNAVAYYMKSELDSTGAEYITLNPDKIKNASRMSVLSTLAHEGYPGHLYAYVYSKELGLSNIATIMTSTGHGEGWATYVTTKLYEYIRGNSDELKTQLVMDYLYANEISGFLLETRLDAGIHLQGWGPTEVANYMNKVGYGTDGAEDLYKMLIEMPSQYASYGYGKIVMLKLHNQAKKILGIHYDEIEFNAMILSYGWTDLQILEETYNEYMMTKCHELGISYNG